jgi:Zn-dependent peptidase ImmA (M78 family)
MGRGTEVPITPQVLEWAIGESGFSDDTLATALKVSLDTLQSWKTGDARPNLTQFRRLSNKLHRQRATFLLPRPPAIPEVQLQFRDISGRPARDLNPVERRYTRRAERMQRVLGWLAAELQAAPRRFPTNRIADEPEAAAADWRDLLRVTTDHQKRWKSSSVAFDEWRVALENIGVETFLFPLGSESCRGFSLWHDTAPVIAINTAWSEEARIYTLFHELGHLATRSNSACAEWGGRATRPRDPVERWCERFAAGVLLPRSDVLRAIPVGQPVTLALASNIARQFRVSLRAATIRLIELGLASWDLYDEIPAAADAKPEGGGGGGGRNRLQLKEDEFGSRGTGLFVEGVRRELITRSQAIDYLDIPDPAFDALMESGTR